MPTYTHTPELAEIELLVIQALIPTRLENHEVAYLARVIGDYVVNTVLNEHDRWEGSDENVSEWDQAYEDGYTVGYESGRRDMRREMSEV